MIHLLWLSLAIPVIIHLVHRRKAKQVPFSTLRFLRLVDQRVARRQRLKEFILLALRVLLIAALIGALYRPMVRSATFKGANVPTTAAIVLDNTYSMRTVQRGALRFDRAKRVAADVIGALEAGDDACLVLFDAPAGTAADPTTGLTALRDQVLAMECGYGTAQVSDALARAAAGLERSSNPRKEVYVISDFQELSWTPAAAEAARQFGADTPVFLVDVGGEVGENLTVAHAEFGLNVQVAGAESTIYCDVVNTGTINTEKELGLYLDGEKVADQEVALSAGARTTVTFGHVFARTGRLLGEVRLASDELEADNTWSLAIDVRDRLPVLLVNGDPSAVPHLDETFFLELALKAPSHLARAVSPLDVKTVNAAEVGRLRLEDYACVVLANVARPGDLLADRLRQYVESGGGLIVFCGNRVDPAAYNTELCPVGRPPLMPALLGEAVGQVEEDRASAFRVTRVAEDHPVFRPIAEQLDLGGVRVFRYLAVGPARTPVEVTPLMEMDGAPLLLEGRAGSGTVVLCTSSADLDWNNLPARRLFLPLVHQLVYYTAGAGSGLRDAVVGDPLVVSLPPTDDPIEVTFVEPDGSGAPSVAVAAASAEGSAEAELRSAARPGIYRARYTLGEAGHESIFAVNVDPVESNPLRMGPAAAADMLGAPAVRIVDDPGDITAVVRREREGLPLWDYLFALAIAIALVESLVGNVLLKH